MSAEVDTTTAVVKPPKKNREIIHIMQENVKGHVKWYDVSKNYGFISRDDNGADVFVHRSVISHCSRRYASLRPGEEVQFSVVETDQGIEAYAVTGPEGKPLKSQQLRFQRRRMRGNNHYDDYGPAEHQSGRENGDAVQHQLGSNPKGSQRRSGGHRYARQGKENHQQQQPSSDVGGTGDGHYAGEGDSPNQSDQRQRRPRRRPPPYRNRNMPSGNGAVPGSMETATQHQSDGVEEHAPRMRRRPRYRRPANGQVAKEAVENGHEAQQREPGEQPNGAQRGPYRGQRRHFSKGKSRTTAVADSTETENRAVEEIVTATERCKLDDQKCAVPAGGEHVSSK